MPDFIERDAQEVFEEEFLEFAGYNLQRRALPDARDGCKWGARKLIHAQMLGKLTHNKPFKKAIKSVSQAMGFSYTHGNASAYGTFIRMAKPFAYRYPLQEAKGNYGTLINPDDHSADRYVELRGSEVAALLLKNLEKDTITEWEDTYDMEGQFPKVLPAMGFWNGVNGCISIGSGMSSSLPPLNLKETNEAMIRLLWNPEISDDEILCYPDFPTGATLLNKEEVKQSLLRGNGNACKVRATIEWDAKDRCLAVKELPYSVYTNTICNELAALMDENENCGIKDFCDYTKQKPDLRIYLQKSATPDKVLKLLYKETSLQSYFSINMTVLDMGITPVVMNQRQLFQAHLDHERLVYRRSFEFDLNKIRARLHIIEGLLKAIDAIDEVIHTIKASASTTAASVALQKLLSIDEIQAKAILDIKLSRLAHLEVNKLVDEKAKLEPEKARIEAILADETLLKKEIENGLRMVATKFGDARRTCILDLSSDSEGEVIEKKSLIVNLTNYGNIYAHEQSTLITQRRGGAGSKIKLQNGECVIESVVDTNLGTLMAFSDSGRGYSYPMSELPIDSFVNVSEIFKLTQNEKISNIMSYSNADYKYVIFITEQGMIKKTELKEYKTKGARGSQAIRLRDGDSICRILFMNEEDIGLLSANGQFIRFATSDITSVGKVAMGVAGAKLNPGDKIIDARALYSEVKEIVSLTSDGMISRTSLDDMPKTNRNVKGTKIQKVNDGETLVGFVAMRESGDIIATTGLTAIKFNTREVSLTGRGALGVKALKLKAKEKATGIMGV